MVLATPQKDFTEPTRPYARPAIKVFPLYRFLSLTADFMIQFAIPIVVYQVTNSVVFSGIAFFLEWLPRILIVPLLGRFVDSYPNAKQFGAIDALRIASLVGASVVSGLPAFIVLLSLFSILNGYAYLVVERTVASLTGGNRSGKTQAKLQAADNLAQVAGPAMAGITITLHGFQAVALVGVALFLMGMILIKTTEMPDIAQHGDAAAKKPHDRYTAFKILLRSPKLLRMTFLTMMINLVEGIMFVLLPAIMLDNYGEMPWGIGLLAGAASAFSALVLYTMSFFLRYVELRSLAILSGAVMTSSAILIGSARELLLFACAFVAFIVGRTVFTVYMRTERIKAIPHEHLGKTISVMISLILLPMPLAGAIAAFLGNYFRSEQIIMLIASFAVLMTVLLAIAFRKEPW